jgi:hypothetical protein
MRNPTFRGPSLLRRGAALRRQREARLAVLGTAVVASTLMFIATTTAREHPQESTLVTVAPVSAGKVLPHVPPADAVPMRVDETTTSTSAPAPAAAPPESTLPPSTTRRASASAAPATSAAGGPSLEQAAPETTSPPTTAPSTTAPATTAPAPATTAPAAAAKNCAVRLHGKGGSGAGTTTSGNVTYLSPTGNANGWGGRQWLYFPDSAYVEARNIVASAIDAEGCTRVTLDGFSNGGAFAAKLHCRGESFGGRLVGVIIDDPVVDHAVTGCAPAAGVSVTLYWTGALAGQSYPGWNCADADWTCDGGSTIGIDAYAAALGAPVKASPNSGHAPYLNPPELTRF